MRRAFYFDQTKCKGCNTCSVACKDWNQINPGPVRWRKQITHETKNAPFFFPLSMACNHCEKPACRDICPSQAIIKREEDGVVYVDKTKCTGQNVCITACPFAEPQRADDNQEPNKIKGWVVNHPMQKCDFCRERIDKGLNPICVDSCVTHALDYGDFDYLKSKYTDAVELSEGEFPYAFINNKTDTKPSFLIKKRETAFTISKLVTE